VLKFLHCYYSLNFEEIIVRKCDICGKGTTAGHNVSHSQRKTKRKWHPNLQYKKMPIEGKVVRVRICTRCLRNQAKAKKATPKKSS